MQLQIWSDYACPYCYIGKRHLEQALAEFEHAAEIEVVFRTFELDRNASSRVVNTTQQRIENKYRKTPESALDMINHIVAMGDRAGLKMNYASVRYTNTFDAHRLTRYAHSMGVATEVSERLFRAYFTENLELADHNVLLQIACDVGLGRDETQSMLNSDAFSNEARTEEAQAEQLGIHGVPFFVFQDGLGLSGAQPKAILLKALQAAWDSSHAASPDRAPACDGDACDIPQK